MSEYTIVADLVNKEGMNVAGVDFTAVEWQFIYFAVKNVHPDYRSPEIETKINQLL